jgi:hypothetical protein
LTTIDLFLELHSFWSSAWVAVFWRSVTCTMGKMERSTYQFVDSSYVSRLESRTSLAVDRDVE